MGQTIGEESGGDESLEQPPETVLMLSGLIGESFKARAIVWAYGAAQGVGGEFLDEGPSEYV